MKKNTMRKLLALVLALAMTAGCAVSVFAETSTTPINILIMQGDTKDKPWETDGVEVTDQTGASIRGKNDGSGEVDINGSITTEGEDVDGLVVYVYQSADVDVIVDGEVTTVYTGEDDTVYNTGVEVTAAGSAVTTVETGDVTVDGGSGCAVLVRTNEDGEAEVQTGNIDSSGEGLRIEANGGPVDAETGNIDAEGDGVFIMTYDADAEATATVGDIAAGSDGVYVVNEGGTVEVTAGEIEAVESGVTVRYDADWEQTDLTKDEFDALNLDPAEATEHFGYVDSDDTTHYTRNWKDSEGVNYNVMGYYSDETTFVEESYWKNAPVYNPSEVTVTVDGGITVENDNGEVTGLQVSPNPNIPDTKLDVTVTGDVDVTAANSEGYAYATGVAIGSAANGADYNVEINGDLNVSSENYAYAEGISFYANDADVNISVDGELSVTVDEGRDSRVVGIEGRAEDGANVSVTIGEGVKVVSENTVDDVDVVGINVSTGTLGSNKIDIEILDGGITVDGDGATAIATTNYSGEINISVVGDVVSSGTGMYMGSGNLGMSAADTGEANEAAPETKTQVTVDGDVKAEDVGAVFILRNEKASMDVLVDGTISGEVSSVVLEEGTIADNVTLTVWEVKKNDDGSVAQTRSWAFDEEANRQTRVFEENWDFEKKIQYIIRVEQPEIGSVATAGTKKYEEYDVAHEGDTVTLKVTVPDGYQLADAFNGTDTKVKLLKDADGNFYLTVPRGGAVLLSVSIEKIQEEKKEESAKGQESEQQQEQKEEQQEQQTPAIAVEPVTDDVVIDTLEEVAEVPAAPVVNDTPEKMDDTQITAAVEELLTKNGELENSVVTVETDASGVKTVVIAPETTEAGEDSTVLQLTVPAEMLTQLADSDVQQITMVSQSGGATVSMDIAAVLEAAAGKQGAKLVMNIEENSESIQNAMQALPTGFTAKAGAVAVTARIEDAEGNVIVLDKSANIILKLNVEFEEGMKILFVDAEGNVSETEAVWVEAADGVPGHWEVPFLGEGTYLPVVADK